MLIYGKVLDNGASVGRQSSLHCCRAIALADKSRQRSEKMFWFIETVLILRISFSFSLHILFSTTFKLLIHSHIEDDDLLYPRVATKMSKISAR